MENKSQVSKATLLRLPRYLRILKKERENGIKYISVIKGDAKSYTIACASIFLESLSAILIINLRIIVIINSSGQCSCIAS